MSDWKNPNFRNDDWQRWATPKVETPKEKIDASLFIRGLAGFILVVAINAFAIFAFLNVLGFSVSYRDSTIASVVFVLWRVYDIVLFRRFRTKE
jgi:hypothetical protein